MKFKIFGDSKELIEFANKFIVDESNTFTISITKILHDIEDSVIRQTDGYMARLQDNYKNLQAKFDNAIQQIYDPKIIN
jgi:hypothetical protein